MQVVGIIIFVVLALFVVYFLIDTIRYAIKRVKEKKKAKEEKSEKVEDTTNTNN